MLVSACFLPLSGASRGLAFGRLAHDFRYGLGHPARGALLGREQSFHDYVLPLAVICAKHKRPAHAGLCGCRLHYNISGVEMCEVD
jgi:hypothetical protein